MIGRILCAGLLTVAFILANMIFGTPKEASPANHLNNQSVESVKTEKQGKQLSSSVQAKANGESNTLRGSTQAIMQEPSPRQPAKPSTGDLAGDEPETPQAQAKVAVQVTPVTPKDIAKRKAAERGWTGAEWDALVDLWQKESGWNPNAVNKHSGACGIPQALPCSKIPNPSSVESQIDWGLEYISNRYKTPSKALAFWLYEAPKYNGEHWY